MRSRRDLRPPWQAASEPPPLRVAVELPASIQEHLSCPLDVMIRDMTTDEIRLWAGFRLGQGRVARLFLPGLAPLRCRVQWSRSRYASVLLDQPLHPTVIRHLAARHPPTTVREPID